ncbi:hypothetical protein SOM59_15605 [Pseudomonas coleopterorum]|uniref:hypothetical protein n=1 Tax=Pseudomonas coleopterorum TaxID=1605838 RepID=UPI002A69D5F1|nr:hypothetical protein [Pseudomonas coleopterorum]MDY1018518.1 hypothetical protein [Pseudomonas coleopterorum]
MGFLKSLFRASQPYRCYVALDRQGLCRAFKQCQLPPSGDGWVEVGDIRPQWLGQPLPAHARVSAHVTGAGGIRAVHA